MNETLGQWIIRWVRVPCSYVSKSNGGETETRFLVVVAGNKQGLLSLC